MIKPTLEEVEKYIKDEGFFDVNPEKWWNYYESVGWKIGKKRAPMVNWKSAIVTWTHTTKTSRLLHKTKECSCGCGRKPMMIIDGKPYASERCLKKIQLQSPAPELSGLTQNAVKPIPAPENRKPLIQSQINTLLKDAKTVPVNKPYIPLPEPERQRRLENMKKQLALKD